MARYQSRLFNWIDNSLPAKLGRRARDCYEQVGNPVKQAAETVRKNTTKAILYPVYILASATNLRSKSKSKEVPLLLRPVQSLVLWIDNSKIFSLQKPPYKSPQKLVKPKYPKSKGTKKSRNSSDQGISPWETSLLDDQNQALNLHNSEEDFKRIQKLIRDAIAYFFGKKPLAEKLKSVKNRQPWLTMADIFDDDATVWPPHKPESSDMDQSGQQSELKAIASYDLTNKLIDQSVSISRKIANNISPSSNKIISSLPQELDNSPHPPTESSRPMYAWIETQATFLGYIYNPFIQLIEWLDQLIATVERWIINLWQQLLTLLCSFFKLF
jgi:hypothetical protein